jgi:hypothetical protein
MKVERIFFAALFLGGMILFMSGMHGVDIAWNMDYLEENFNLSFYDSNYLGQVRNAGEIYTQSMFSIMAGFVVSIISGMMVVGGEE